MTSFRAALAALCLLTACGDDADMVQRPDPLALSEDALGHYCQMHLLDHDGPKGQIHLVGHPAPIWFSQVRDSIAYIKSGERVAEITAFYVNDMGRAPSWAKPGDGNWIAAGEAYFVVGSDAIGGMGAPEVVPFSASETAEAFAAERGGTVLRLDTIPTAAVLAPMHAIDTEEESKT